jgi:hypothetical protein
MNCWGIAEGFEGESQDLLIFAKLRKYNLGMIIFFFLLSSVFLKRYFDGKNNLMTKESM